MPRTDRRWAALTLVGAGLLLPVLLLVGGPASAAVASVDHQAWARSGPLAPTDPQDDTLYVSSAGRQEQARTYIDLALPDLTRDQLDSGVLVLTEGEGSLLADHASLKACGLVTPLTDDGELEQAQPEVDCETSDMATRLVDGTWEIPLQAFAALLAGEQLAGIAVLSDPDAATSPAHTVAFDAAKTAVVVVPAAATSDDTGTTQTGEPTSRTEGAQSSEGTAAAVGSDLPFTASGSDTVLQAPAVPVPELGDQPPEPVALGPPAQPAPELIRPVAAEPAGSSRSALLVPLVVLVGALLLLSRTRIVVPRLALPGGRRTGATSVGLPAKGARRLLPWLVIPCGVMLLSEATAYKFGVIAIIFIGAIGLHILVNVAGELSLAHAAFVGIPAFAVAQVSARADISPVLAVPVGVVAGVAIGLVVAVTALRARGLQVALVTLAVAIATVQFLFFREWLIGPPEGFAVPVPSLFGIDLSSNISRVPVLAVLVAVATLAGTAIIHSKIGRGLSLVRADPDVAAAAGVPVALYRGMAYAIAGGFAGLAGSCYVIWVQLVSPQAFPLQLGFTYLLIAALAGRGGLGGVAVSAVIVQGGALFTFLPRSITLFVAPVLLILQVTRFEGGINASLRDVRLLLANKKWSSPMSLPAAGSGATPQAVGVRLGSAVGALLVAAGFVAIAVAWYNTGRTNQLWIQNQEIVSGGFVGLGLIILGSTLLLRDALLHGGATVRERVYTEPRFVLDPTMLPQQSLHADSGHSQLELQAAATGADDPLDTGAARKAPRTRVRS